MTEHDRCQIADRVLSEEPWQRLPWSAHPDPEKALKALHDLVMSFDRVMTEDEEKIARELEEAIRREP